ncbi:phage tail protein [Halomonas sp. SCS19]|uniref:phage tail protein n=1 Tax=Halomonas sp. SCS19 TaxID=2950870 RepID=UPI0032DEF0A4
MEIDFLPDIGREPDYGLIGGGSFAVDAVSFGDGYEQRRPAGINSSRREWTVTWSLITQEQMERLRDFLVERRGAYAFLWQVSGEPEAWRVACKEHPKVTEDTFKRHTLTATFIEDFGL